MVRQAIQRHAGPLRSDVCAPSPPHNRRCPESRVESYLRQHGVSHEEFLAALRAADASGSSERRSLTSSLIEVQNFEAFAKLCQQRALEKED